MREEDGFWNWLCVDSGLEVRLWQVGGVDAGQMDGLEKSQTVSSTQAAVEMLDERGADPGFGENVLAVERDELSA